MSLQMLPACTLPPVRKPSRERARAAHEVEILQEECDVPAAPWHLPRGWSSGCLPCQWTLQAAETAANRAVLRPGSAVVRLGLASS